jgi:hypothetical protein
MALIKHKTHSMSVVFPSAKSCDVLLKNSKLEFTISVIAENNRFLIESVDLSDQKIEMTLQMAEEPAFLLRGSWKVQFISACSDLHYQIQELSLFRCQSNRRPHTTKVSFPKKNNILAQSEIRKFN